jgi:hypothetical protein
MKSPDFENGQTPKSSGLRTSGRSKGKSTSWWKTETDHVPVNKFGPGEREGGGPTAQRCNFPTPFRPEPQEAGVSAASRKWSLR